MGSVFTLLFLLNNWGDTMKSKYTISEKSESHIFFHSFLSNKTIKAPLEAIKSYEDLKKVTGINEYLERYNLKLQIPMTIIGMNIL